MRRVAFHPFLLALLPILFLAAQNHGQVPAGDLLGNVFVPTLVVMTGVAVMFGASLLLSRSSHVASAVTSLAVIILLWYRPLRTAIEIVTGHSFRHRSSLLPMFGLFVVATLLLLRNHKLARALTGPLNTFCLILLAMIGLQFSVAEWNRMRSPWTGSAVFGPGTDWKDDDIADSVIRRSIYFIVLDGYARNDVLEDVFSFDNTSFTDALRSRGFLVNPRSRSNYALTFLSLASTLNGTHLTDLATLDATKDRTTPYRMIGQSRVMEFLGSEGYSIVNLASGWSGTGALSAADVTIRCGPSEFHETWLRQTAAWPLMWRSFQEDIYQTRLCQLQRLAETPNMSGPKFVLAHLLLPHAPYVFAANGERIEGDFSTQGDETVWEQKDRYLAQLHFVNRAVLAVIDSLIAQEDPAPIIVVQSDHGPASNGADGWTASNKALVRARMPILNALFLPDLAAADQVDNLTPVNTFPIVLNRYFGTRWSLSPDASYFSSYDRPYEFTRVDSLLSGREDSP